MRLLDRFAAGQIIFCVPDLFWPELGNIGWKSVRIGRMSREAVENGDQENLGAQYSNFPDQGPSAECLHDRDGLPAYRL